MEEETITSISGGNSPSVDFYERLASSVRPGDREWMKSFRHNAHRPFHIAVMFQEDLPTIQHLYQKYPDQLDADTVLQACKYGSKPGVIPFLLESYNGMLSGRCLLALCSSNEGYYNPGEISLLARETPEAVSAGQEYDVFPISATMCRDPMEQYDIQTLLDLWPECVVYPMAFPLPSTNDSPEATPLQMCLSLGWSEQLLSRMMEKVPRTFERLTIRQPLAAQDLEWINLVFQRCQGKLIWGDILLGKGAWEGPEIHRFLESCFCQNHTIKEMELYLPEEIDDSPEESNLLCHSLEKFNLAHFQISSRPSTEKMTLRFSHPGYCSTLGVLPEWPNLLELDLSLENCLEPSVGALANLLEEGRLLCLQIDTSMIYPRAEEERKELSQQACQPLFDALGTNQSLKTLGLLGLQESIDLVCFRYFKARNWHTEEKEPPPDDEVTLFCKLLLEALKQNTTLTIAGGFIPGESNGTKKLSDSEFSEEQERIGYYLKLNHCGRKLVQDESVMLCEFVSLLGSVGDQLGVYYEESSGVRQFPEDQVNALYGLLHEGIGKWT